MRSVRSLFTASLEARHWIALSNAFRITDRPIWHLTSYITQRSAGYPTEIGLRTPIGNASAKLFVSDDILTLNEIFCRLDYQSSSEISTVVDFGANIGIASLYFVTRNSRVQVWSFEPNEANLSKLDEQLEPYADRVRIMPMGIAATDGELVFGFEPTGRYGGAGLDFPVQKTVPVKSADGFLRELICEVGSIDVVKVDIESMENEILRSLSDEVVLELRTILVEGQVDLDLFEATHRRTEFGPITRFSLI